MNTSSWGPAGWKFLLNVAAGYDLNEAPKNIKDAQYTKFFESIGDILPCKYCRQSYVPFYESLDIKRYLDMPSCGLIRFVYDMKQLVSNKLKAQEAKALHEEFNQLSNRMSKDDPKFWETMRENAKKICATEPTPDFQKV